MSRSHAGQDPGHDAPARGTARDAGQATLELLALLPTVLLLAGLLLQLGAVAWAITDTTEAARQGARASSMGQDGCTAAERALSGGLADDVLSCSSGGGQVVLQVAAPIFLDALPPVRISREATLPDLADR